MPHATRLLSLCFLFFTCWAILAGGETLSIGDSGYPHLYFMEPAVPVIWHLSLIHI
mgnify:CR=1 FL=1